MSEFPPGVEEEILEELREILGIARWWNPKHLGHKIKQCELIVGIENTQPITAHGLHFERVQQLLRAMKKLDDSLDKRLCRLHVRPEGLFPNNEYLHSSKEPSLPDKCMFLEKVMVEEKGIVMEEDLPTLQSRVKQIKVYLR